MNNIQSDIEFFLQRWYSKRSIGYRSFPSGKHNRITDVSGVSVGHSTIEDGDRQTGVTAILATQTNIYNKPLPCGVAILNGFSKPTGVIQIQELGTLETPIILTNTLSVGRAFSGVVRYMINHNPEIGRSLATVNPLVLECNDGYLNDIQALAVTEDLVIETLLTTASDFERGSVGAGRGMSCFALKGGIGTSSCYIEELQAMLGVLVLANFGELDALQLEGIPFGETIKRHLQQGCEQKDKGSIIIIMATDAPLDARQLKRVAKRAGAGLGRLGSYWGHGSGDIAVTFTTNNQIEKIEEHELDPLLRAAAEGTEQAVLDALLQATPVTGFKSNQRRDLSSILDQLSSLYLK